MTSSNCIQISQEAGQVVSPSTDNFKHVFSVSFSEGLLLVNLLIVLLFVLKYLNFVLFLGKGCKLFL